MSAFATLKKSSSFWPSLNQLAKSVRGTAALNSNQIVSSGQVLSAPDTTLGPFAQTNLFNLPGDTAVSLPSISNSPYQMASEDKHVESLENENTDLVEQFTKVRGQSLHEVQVSAHECPTAVRSDVEALFPNETIPWPLTAVTIAQHTENDMVTWSAAVAEERDILTAQLVSTATLLCRELQTEGYFADFIDPSSGRPFLTDGYTPASLFETDPIQRHFGVEVKDLGCCKAVAHVIWGTKVFIGTLFTNAPLDSPTVKRVLTPAE